MKINLVIQPLLVPQCVDNIDKKYTTVLTIVENRDDNEIRYFFGLDIGLNNPYIPYWYRTLDKESATRLRDLLTNLIEDKKCQK